MNHISPLIAFYEGTGVDHRGRKIDDIIRWDDTQLEGVHDYIQWLFPLPERSPYNPFAPLLSPAETTTFIQRVDLRSKVDDVFDRIVDFYGFERDDSDKGPVVEKSREYQIKSRRWLTPQNHNYLRITRIIRFLMLIEMRLLAKAFWRALAEPCRYNRGVIGEQTVGFWMRAAEA